MRKELRFSDEQHHSKVRRVAPISPRKKVVGSEFCKKSRSADGVAARIGSLTKEWQDKLCRCTRRCGGKWSDNRHGSHGFQCKVNYERYLTLKEKCLSQGYSNRPNSKSQHQAFGVVEFCGGVLAISTAWKDCGVEVLGVVERQPILLQNAKRLHPHALVCNDVRSSEWRQWDFGGRAEVVTGGPPCQPYSEAGPQHGSGHKDSDQICILAEAARHFGARWVNYENVPKLVQKFRAFFQESVDFYKTLGFILLDASVLRHDWLGGKSVRARVWPLFECASVSCFLPQWVPVSQDGRLHPGCIADALLPMENLDEQDLAPGKFVQCSPPVVRGNGVTIAGYLCSGGEDYTAHRGCRVLLYGSTKEFVVLEINSHWMYLLQDDRQSPRWLTTRTSKLRQVVEYKEPVYSIQGTAPTLRVFKVPSGGNSFLILDVRTGPTPVFVRPLRGAEMWNIHALSLEVADSLKSLGASCSDLGRWSGAAIPAEMCNAQVGRLHSRIHMAHAIEDVVSQSSIPWVHCRAPAVPGTWKSKLLLVVISTNQSGFKIMTGAGRQALPGKCFTEGEKAQCRVETAQGWAGSVLKQPGLVGFMAAELQAPDLSTQMVIVPVSAEIHCNGTEWVSVNDLSNSQLAEVALLAKARVESLLGKPHALGPLEVQLRNVVQRR